MSNIAGNEMERRRWLAGTLSAAAHAFVIGGLVIATAPVAPPDTPIYDGYVRGGLLYRRPPPPPSPPGVGSSLPEDGYVVHIVENDEGASVGSVSRQGFDDDNEDDGIDVMVAGVVGGVTGGIVGGLAEPPFPPPSWPSPAPLPSIPLRAGRGAPIPIKIVDVQPTYPPLARKLRIQGDVVLDATIAEDGRVVDICIVRSVPSLDRAAADAVRRWRFVPATIDGRAVPVLLTVTVNFVL